MANPTIVTDVTYAQLVALIQGNNLEEGLSYKITDFATIHYMIDGNATVIEDGGNFVINTGTNEPVTVLATSVNTIAEIAKSVLYPLDIIYYDWNPENWLEDLSFSDNHSTIITGFKGVIYFRHDTLLDNYMGYDFRNVKFRRWEIGVAEWSSGTTYTKGQMVVDVGRTEVYQSAINGNLNNALPDYMGDTNWVAIVDTSESVYLIDNATSRNGIIAGANYIDVLTFAEKIGEVNATYNVAVRGNHFACLKDNYNFFGSWGSCSILTNNVFFLRDEGYYNVLNNRFDGTMFSNTITGDFQNWKTSETFGYNIIGRGSSYNTTSNECTNNIIEGQFINNIIGGPFTNNILSIGCGSNIIRGVFHNIITAKNFQKNTVASISHLDLYTATHVYGDYSCDIVKTSTGTFKLKYIDGSDNTEKIVDVTS